MLVDSICYFSQQIKNLKKKKFGNTQQGHNQDLRSTFPQKYFPPLKEVLISYFKKFDKSTDIKIIGMADSLTQNFSIQRFRKENGGPVFQEALEYPDFFRTQLLDPHRIIKVFSDDPHTYERIFYFQYLKLCENLGGQDSQLLIGNLKQLIANPDFYFIFPENQTEYPYTDEQFKQLVLEFISLLEKTTYPVDRMLQKYPIMDLVFTYMNRSLLIFNKKAYSVEQFVDKNEALGNLCAIFDLETQECGPCLHFVDSDVFVCEENISKVYMVYVQEPSSTIVEIEQENQNVEAQVKEQEKSLTDQNEKAEEISNKQKKKYLYDSMNSGIYEFVDYTSNMNDGNKFGGEFESQALKKSFQVKKQNTLQNSMKNSIDKIQGYLSDIQCEQIEEINNLEEEKDNFSEGNSESEEGAGDFNQFCSVVLPRNMKDLRMTAPSQPTESNRYSDQKTLTEENCEEKAKKNDILLPTNRSSTNKEMDGLSDISSEDFKENPSFAIPNLGEKPFKTESIIYSLPMKNDRIQEPTNFQPKNYQQSEKTNIFKRKDREHFYAAESTNPQNEDYQTQKNSSSSKFASLTQGTHSSEQSLDMKNFGRNRQTIQNNVNFYEQGENDRKKRRLNVTREFTNSFIMSQMAEPFATNTRISRERARAYRKSIQNVL